MTTTATTTTHRTACETSASPAASSSMSRPPSEVPDIKTTSLLATALGFTLLASPVGAQPPMTQQNDSRDIPPRQVAAKAAVDAVKNALFYGVGALLVYWLAGMWRAVGSVGFGVFALLAVLIAVQVAISLVSSAAIYVMALFQRRPLEKGEGWMVLAMLFQILELVVFAALTYWLWQRVSA